MTDKKSEPSKPKAIEKAWHFPRENKTIFAESFTEAKKKLQTFLKTKKS